jgi:hypothetical protein
MTDDDLLTEVRHSLTAARDALADVRMARPAETLMDRARRRRLRRGLTGAAAVAGAAALTVTTLLAGGDTGSARLAAWTVTAQPGGRVVVTIRELRDPAGLQRALRADGVPASVHFGDNNNPPSCLYYPFSPAQYYRLEPQVFPEDNGNALGEDAFVIDPGAIPAGVGLWITVGPVRDQAGQGGMSATSSSSGWTFVYASGRCPGA